VYAKKMGIIRRNLESGHHKKNPTRRSLGKIKKKKDRKQREWERERERKNPKNIKKKKKHNTKARGRRNIGEENKSRRNNTSYPSNEHPHQSSLKKLATAVQQQVSHFVPSFSLLITLFL
jgi:hypothetical protein